MSDYVYVQHGKAQLGWKRGRALSNEEFEKPQKQSPSLKQNCLRSSAWENGGAAVWDFD